MCHARNHYVLTFHIHIDRKVLVEVRWQSAEYCRCAVYLEAHLHALLIPNKPVAKFDWR